MTPCEISTTANTRLSGSRMRSNVRTRSTQKLPSSREPVRVIPRIRAIATTMPAAADTKFCTVLPEHVGEVADAQLARVPLPVRVGHEADRRVERPHRADTGPVGRVERQDTLQAVQHVEDQHRHQAERDQRDGVDVPALLALRRRHRAAGRSHRSIGPKNRSPGADPSGRAPYTSAMYRPRNGTVAASSTTRTSAWTSACQLIRTAPGGSARGTGRPRRGRRCRARSSCRCRPRRSCRHPDRRHVDGRHVGVGTPSLGHRRQARRMASSGPMIRSHQRMYTTHSAKNAQTTATKMTSAMAGTRCLLHDIGCTTVMAGAVRSSRLLHASLRNIHDSFTPDSARQIGHTRSGHTRSGLDLRVGTNVYHHCR